MSRPHGERNICVRILRPPGSSASCWVLRPCIHDFAGLGALGLDDDRAELVTRLADGEEGKRRQAVRPCFCLTAGTLGRQPSRLLHPAASGSHGDSAATATKRQPRAVVATPASDQISGDGAKCGRRRRRLERSVRTYRAKSATNGSGAGAPQAPGWVTFKSTGLGGPFFNRLTPVRGACYAVVLAAIMFAQSPAPAAWDCVRLTAQALALGGSVRLCECASRLSG